jgi:c-di-GMP-binding flagellar brake protein YcgR
VSLRGLRRDRSRPPAARPRPAGELPRVGTVVELGIAERARTWLTRIEAADGARLVVVAPTEPRGDTVEFAPGGAVRVSWPTDLGVMIAEGRLVEVEQDVVAAWVLEVQRTDRQQRRTAFRLPIVLAAALRPIGGPSVPAEAQTEDLSETGVSCTVGLADAPDVGTTVEVTVAVPDDEPLVAHAHVVRAQPLPRREGEPLQTRLGLQLVDDDPERRERLRRYVLDEQLRRRRSRG